MRLNSIFLAIIVASISLTGCSTNKQPVKQVSDVNTTKTDNINKAENNDSPILLSTINDSKNSKDITFTNGYKSAVNQEGTFTIAELGALKADPKQGIAVIKTINKDTMKIINEVKLLTPEKHGSIKAYGVNAFNITAKATDGFSWILNVYDGFR